MNVCVMLTAWEMPLLQLQLPVSLNAILLPGRITASPHSFSSRATPQPVERHYKQGKVVLSHKEYGSMDYAPM